MDTFLLNFVLDLMVMSCMGKSVAVHLQLDMNLRIMNIMEAVFESCSQVSDRPTMVVVR